METKERYISESMLKDSPKKNLGLIIKDGAVTWNKLGKDVQDRIKRIEAEIKGLKNRFLLLVTPDTWYNPGQIFEIFAQTSYVDDIFESIKLYVNDVLVAEAEDVSELSHSVALDGPSVIKGVAVIRGHEYTQEVIIKEAEISITRFTASPNIVEKGTETTISFAVRVSAPVSKIEVKQGDTVVGIGEGSVLDCSYQVLATSTDSIPFTAYAYHDDAVVSQKTLNITVTEPAVKDEFWIGAGTAYADIMVDANKHEVVNNTMDGMYEVTAVDWDRFFIVMKANMKEKYYQNRGLFMLFEVPMNESAEGEYIVMTSRNQYEGGTHNLEIKRR